MRLSSVLAVCCATAAAATAAAAAVTAVDASTTMTMSIATSTAMPSIYAATSPQQWTTTASTTGTRSETSSSSYSASRSATHSATQSATRSATHSATQSATRSATHSATRSATRSATHSASYSTSFSATPYSATESATESETFTATASYTASATSTPTPYPTPTVPTNIRAMYVWSYSDCLFNEARPYESLCGVSDYLAFQNLILANVTNPWNSFAAYNRIYVEIDPALFATNSSIVSSFVALAHSMGVAVEFLAGDATWVETAENATIPKSYCDAVVEYNQGVSNSTYQLDGIHFDIEPNEAPYWLTYDYTAIDRYNQFYEYNLMNILGYCKNITRRTTLTVAWVVSNTDYYYVTGLWEPLKQDPYVDYIVSIMYTNNANDFMYGESYYDAGVIGGVVQILAYLNGSVPVVFDAETIAPPYAPVNGTFWTQGAPYLEEVLTTVNGTFGGHVGFAGTSTHWFGSYFSPVFQSGGLQPSCNLRPLMNGVTVSTYTSTFACVNIFNSVWRLLRTIHLNTCNPFNTTTTVLAPDLPVATNQQTAGFYTRFSSTIGPNGACETSTSIFESTSTPSAVCL